MRYLCHKAGKQPHVFENENRHSRAEVPEGCRHLSKAWEPCGGAAPPLALQGALILASQ